MTGGHDGSNFLSSTEILSLDTSNWLSAASLPSPRLGLRGATAGNSLFVSGIRLTVSLYIQLENIFTGGRYLDDYYDEIFFYEPETDTWSESGNMGTPRQAHSVSVIPNIDNLCN